MKEQISVVERAKMALSLATKKNTLSGLRPSEIEDFLLPMVGQIQNALPSGASITPSRVIAMAAYQISQNPALAECEIPSLVGALMQTALLGLNPVLKECHYIPYKNRDGKSCCQFQIDYRGYINLAARTGQVYPPYARIVREGDKFEVVEGLHRNLIHVPKIGNEGRPIAAYACIHMLNGAFDFVVFSPKEIEQRRMASPSQQNAASGVWLKWTDEMWKKTVLRNLLKTVPLSTNQVATALATDGGTIEIQNIKDGEPVAIAYADQDAVIVEAPDLQDIRKGLEEIADLDNLQAYWHQGAKEWDSRQDVRDLFTAKKQELQNGGN